MSILVVAKEFGGAIMGVLWNKYVLQMTKDDYHRLPDAMLIIVTMRMVSISYIYFLPSN